MSILKEANIIQSISLSLASWHPPPGEEFFRVGNFEWMSTCQRKGYEKRARMVQRWFSVWLISRSVPVDVTRHVMSLCDMEVES